MQRIIPLILIVVVIGLVIAAVVSLSHTFFGSGKKASPSASPSASTKVNAGKQALTTISSDSSVRMSVRGPLVADENYHTYTITISTTTRTMTTYQGYSGKTFANDQRANSVDGYTQLVYALSKAKLMDGTPLSGSANDERGVCATGTLYDFEVFQGTTSVQKLWTSTCTGAPGSLKASLTQVTNLFDSQIPDFGTQLQNIGMNV